MIAGDVSDGGENACGGPVPRALTAALWAVFRREGALAYPTADARQIAQTGADRGPSIRVGIFHQPLKNVESREPVTARGTYGSFLDFPVVLLGFQFQ